MRFVATVVAILLAGCASNRVWTKAGASVVDFEMDRGQCQAQAYGAPGMYAVQVALIYDACMRGKGWYLVEGTPSNTQRVAVKREDYKECNDEAEARSGTKNIFDGEYSTAYASCMRLRGHSVEK